MTHPDELEEVLVPLDKPLPAPRARDAEWRQWHDDMNPVRDPIAVMMGCIIAVAGLVCVVYVVACILTLG